MFKTILTVTAIVFGTASVAFASEADANLLNRYPAHNMTKSGAQAFQSSNVALGGGQVVNAGSLRTDSAPITGGGY